MRIDAAGDRAMIDALGQAADAHPGRTPADPVKFPPSRPARVPWRALLAQVLELAGGPAALEVHEERPWASATFAGTRHKVTLAFAGEAPLAAGEAFIAALPDHEFRIPGQLVADAAIVAVTHDQSAGPALRVEAELLLLEDR